MASTIYSVRLNSEQIKVFKAQATARRLTMSRMITEALLEYFESNPLTNNQKTIYDAYIKEVEGDSNNENC